MAGIKMLRTGAMLEHIDGILARREMFCAA